MGLEKQSACAYETRMLTLIFMVGVLSASAAPSHILMDTHIDLPDKLREHPADISTETGGEFDIPKARRGGLDGAFMSIYVPTPEHLPKGINAAHYAEQQIALVENLIAKHPTDLGLAKSPSDVVRLKSEGKIALAMGMENGDPIGLNLERIDMYFQRGIRYITLAHAKDNAICDSSYDTRHTWKGVSHFGQSVIKEMNRVGMIIDVSHISDDAFWQVLKLSSVPVIASHSSLRHFKPGFERNMTDDMVIALAKHGGVVHINFGNYFLGEKSPEPVSASKVADHIDRVVRLVGVDHVGFGSDFDGVFGNLPKDLKTAADYPNLLAELRARGYSEDAMGKMMSGNLFRVWEKVLAARLVP